MQRQLDDDLRESEMEVLMNHTRHCPDCAAMFERLTRLSAELTSLPKVSPSYSLVDAIMPELVRIDNEARQAAAAGNPLMDQQQPMARRPQRTRRWPSWKSISGVVAAGIVAGLFLITNPPQSGVSKDDAGGEMSNSAAMQMPEAAAAQDESAQLRVMTGAGGDDAGGAFVGTESLRDQSGEKLHIDSQEYTITDITAKGIREEQGAAAADAPQEAASEDSIGNTNGAAPAVPEMGITSQGLFPSPDGQYVASVDHYSVVVLSSADGSTLFKSERKNGQHGNLTWSPESGELMYEVSLEHGATQKYAIDMSTLQERKAD